MVLVLEEGVIDARIVRLVKATLGGGPLLKYPLLHPRVGVSRTTKGQLTGIAGTYLVAAKLALLGYNAAVTNRNTKGTDILAENPANGRSVAIQVKTNRATHAYFLMGEGSILSDRFYVLVNIKPSGEEYFVVPGEAAKALVQTEETARGTWRYIERGDAEKYRESWQSLEKALRGR